MYNLFFNPGLQVNVSFPDPTDPTWAELECQSMCGLAGDPPYIWFRNGQNIKQGLIYSVKPQSGDSFSCAVKGYDLRSPLLCKSTLHHNSCTVT